MTTVKTTPAAAPVPPARRKYGLGELVEHNGVLAQARWDDTDLLEPIHDLQLAVSDIPIERYPRLVGVVVKGHGQRGWSGYAGYDLSAPFVDTTDWHVETIRTPLKPPSRGGREWCWRWRNGRWIKTGR